MANLDEIAVATVVLQEDMLMTVQTGAEAARAVMR